MPKSLKLQSSLRAADRRRRRRKQTDSDCGSRLAQSDAKQPCSVGVDAPRILVEAVLHVADRCDGLNDSAVIGALRAIKNGSTSRSVLTQAVSDEMLARLDTAGVGPTQGCKAAEELLKIAVENVDPESPTRLIRYLALISS